MGFGQVAKHAWAVRFFAAAAFLTLVSLAVIPAASASGPQPIVTNVAVSPASVPADGGIATLSATVTGGSICSVSVQPAVPNPPAPWVCSGKALATSVDIDLPPNAAAAPVAYKITLDVTADSSLGFSGTTEAGAQAGVDAVTWTSKSGTTSNPFVPAAMSCVASTKCVVVPKLGGSVTVLDAVTFGREKLKATTKTQGDFNLSNRNRDISCVPGTRVFCRVVGTTGTRNTLMTLDGPRLWGTTLPAAMSPDKVGTDLSVSCARGIDPQWVLCAVASSVQSDGTVSVMTITGRDPWRGTFSSGSGWSTKVLTLHLTSQVPHSTRVVCPDLTGCMLVAADGEVFASPPAGDNGGWTMLGNLFPPGTAGRVSAVDCTAGASCVALTVTGTAITFRKAARRMQVPSNLRVVPCEGCGNPWLGALSGDAQLTRLSCLSASVCVVGNATDGLGVGVIDPDTGLSDWGVLDASLSGAPVLVSCYPGNAAGTAAGGCTGMLAVRGKVKIVRDTGGSF